MSKHSKRLIEALSLLAIEYLQQGRIDMASKVTTVANTLKADPKGLDRLAKILREAK